MFNNLNKYCLNLVKISKEVYEIRMFCLKRQLSVMTDLKPGRCRWIQTLHRLCPGTTLESLPVGQGALTGNMPVHPQDGSSGGVQNPGPQEGGTRTLRLE